MRNINDINLTSICDSFCKLLEPVLLLGKERFAGVDIRVRVKGGGHVAQIYGKQSISSLSIISLMMFYD